MQAGIRNTRKNFIRKSLTANKNIIKAPCSAGKKAPCSPGNQIDLCKRRCETKVFS